MVVESMMSEKWRQGDNSQPMKKLTKAEYTMNESKGR